MPFTSLHEVTLNASIGPFETFEELQAATARQTPGALCVPAGPNTNATSGKVKDQGGNVIGTWGRS